MKKSSEDDRLTRLGEILYRSWYILSQINSDNVSDFMRRYSVDVGEGLQFLKMFGTYFPSIQEHSSANYSKVLSGIVDLDVFKRHLIGGKLSIFHQLEQILARWRVHHWIMDNPEMIRWLSQRNAIYPILLAKLAGKTTMVAEREVPLPTVKIEWLVELAAQHLGSNTMAYDIAKALCDRQYHPHILHFSAKIHEINFILLRIESYTNKSLIQTLNFVFDNPSFFEGILGKENVFRVTFARYLMTNTEARNFCGQIASHKKAMIELFKPINRLNILSNNEKLEYFGPLLNLLVSGVLDSRLPMLVELSNISSDQIERNQVLRVFTWLEQYREIIALTFGPENAWQAWIAKHPEHQPAITAFSKGLSMALLGCELLLFTDLPKISDR